MDEHELIRTFLAERDAACPGCGYNLRGLTGTECPECNQALRLQVALTEPKIAPFVAGLVGVSVGWGGSILMLLLYGVIYFRHGYLPRSGPDQSMLLSVVAGFLIGMGMLPLWMRMRKRIRRQSSIQCWALAAIATSITWIYVLFVLIFEL